MTLAGRPNVGKSTLLNRLVGEKVTITTSTPQTTRHRTRGILDLPDLQIIFLDTPGIHEPTDAMGDQMLDRAKEGWKEGDVLIHVVDAETGWTDADEQISQSLEEYDRPILLVPNKIDRRDASIDEITQEFSDHIPAGTVLPVSAQTGKNTKALLRSLRDLLPEGPRLFPGDDTTDRSRRFLSSEIIREKATEKTFEEVPHSLEVVIDSVEPGNDPEITVVNATVFVERDSQKGIIIGKNGEMIRSIGKEARPDLEELFSSKIYLDLSVDVMQDWTDQPKSIEKLTRRKTQRPS